MDPEGRRYPTLSFAGAKDKDGATPWLGWDCGLPPMSPACGERHGWGTRLRPQPMLMLEWDIASFVELHRRATQIGLPLKWGSTPTLPLAARRTGRGNPAPEKDFARIAGS